MKSRICSSLLLLLLCLGAFHFNQVQAATGACDATKTTCDYCDATTNTKCVTCKTGYFFSSDDCKACTDKTKYLPSYGSKDADCIACTEKCTECNADGTCKTCADGFYLSTDKKTCVACDKGCTICTGTGAGKCATTKCDAGYWESGTGASLQCLACDKGCDVCTGNGAGKCTTTKCSTGYWEKGTGAAAVCVACDAGCDKCTDNGAGKCTTCSAYYFKDGAANSEVCKKCEVGKYLPSGKTLSTECEACPKGKYMKAGGTTLEECVACDTGCAACTGTGSGQCTECSAQYYLESKTCKSCGDGKYLSGTTAADCKTCDTNCAKCTAAGQCSTCSTNYYLDTTCKTCTDKTKYVPVGKSAVGDCTACGLECTECNVDGTCKTCADGRYVSNGRCVTCPTNCKTCDATKCLTCNAGAFYLSSSGSCNSCSTGCTACGTDGKCTTCNTAGYAPVTAAGTCTACPAGCNACDASAKCTGCATGYYEDTTAKTCTACTGRTAGCTTCGSDLKCTACDTSAYAFVSASNTCKACPTGCTGCDADGKCSACAINYSFDSTAKTCTACASDKFALAGTTATCTVCDAGKFFKKTGTPGCTACADAQCKTCTGENAGQCTACFDGFNVVSGTCKARFITTAKRTGSAAGSIRYNMDLDTYNLYGGANYFVSSLSSKLSYPVDQIEVSRTQVGSVIVLFNLFTNEADTITKEALALKIQDAMAANSLNIYPGVVVMDSNAVVLLPNGCPSGQYYDSANYVCKDCTDDICGKKKSKLGAILGGVLGGLAFIIVIGVLIWKKDALLAKMRSNKVNSAQYNNVPAKSPTTMNA